MIQNIVFLFLISFETFFIHSILFPSIELFSVFSFVIFFQALLFFGFVLTLKKPIITLVFIIEALLACGLIVYHKYYPEPITLSVIFNQFREGFIFLEKSPNSLFIKPLIYVGGFLALKLAFIYTFFREIFDKKSFRLIFIIPFILFLVANFSIYHNNMFNHYDFKKYTMYLGYPQSFMYEILTTVEKEKIVLELAQNSKQKAPLRNELKNIRLPKNIYIIQAESLDYAGFKTFKNNRSVMPFLNKIAEKSVVYKIFPKERKASANTDFAVLTGAKNISEFYSLMYYLLKPEVYSKIKTLPQTLEEKGYYTMFYHGFEGGFYTRDEHMLKIGFKEQWFQENLPLKIKKGMWGFEDGDVFDFVTQNNKKHWHKVFNFIITASTHEDFDIGKKQHTKIIKSPKTLKDRYLNSINYLDESIRKLVENAPKDSLFIIYSDHQSEVFEKQDTLMIVYDKNKNLNSYQEIRFDELPVIIKSISQI